MLGSFTNQIHVFRHFRPLDQVSQYFAAPDNNTQVITEFVGLNPLLRDWVSYFHTEPSTDRLFQFLKAKWVALSEKWPLRVGGWHKCADMRRYNTQRLDDSLLSVRGCIRPFTVEICNYLELSLPRGIRLQTIYNFLALKRAELIV